MAVPGAKHLAVAAVVRGDLAVAIRLASKIFLIAVATSSVAAFRVANGH